MPGILIADDHPLFRRGLRQVLEESPDLVVAGEADDGQQALALALSGDFDLVVLDIAMPGGDGIQVLSEIKRERPELPVLVLSLHSEERFAVRALQAGASGYLCKEAAADELMVAIRSVLNGGTYIGATLSRQLVARLRQAKEEILPHQMLSARESEVMRMIASGSTVSEIARQLSVSVKTVSTHRARILSKLDMKNNAALIRYVIENDVVD